MRSADSGIVEVPALERHRFITQERVRNYSMLLLVGGSIALPASAVVRALAPSSAGVLLPDFLAHWTGGRLLLEGRADELYALQAQRDTQVAVGGDAGDLSWYVSPPFVAAEHLPLAALPYLVAATVWTVISAALFALVARHLGSFAPQLWAEHRRLVLLAAGSAYPVFETIGAGQDSAASLAVWVAGVLLMIRGRDVAAGLVLSIGLMKPQLVVLVPVVLLVLGRWRALASFTAGGVVLSAVSLVLVGRSGIATWLNVLTSPLYVEQVGVGQAWKMTSVPALVTGLLGRSGAGLAATAGSVVAVLMGLWFVIWLRRTPANGLTAWTAALATTVAASPHLVLYDAVLLGPVALVLLERDRTGSVARWTTAAYVLAWLAPILHAGSGAVPWLATAVGLPWIAVPVAWLWWRSLHQTVPGIRHHPELPRNGHGPGGS